MTHPNETPALSISALWERSDLSRDGDETGLVVRMTASNIAAADVRRAPLDIAFALDRSGSMHGSDKIELVKTAVISATHHLGEGDRLALVTFDHDVEVLQELTPADASGKQRLQRVLSPVEARGSTDLSGGWLRACQQLAAGARENGTSRLQRALLLTDGLANVGITEPNELVTHATELRKRGIETTTIGVGRHFDEMLLSAMAEAGGGTFEYIDDTARLRPFFEREIGEMMDIVAIRPVLRITFPDGVRGRLVNPFPVNREGKTVIVDLRNLGSGETMDLTFDISIRAGCRADDLAAMAEVEWVHPATGKHAALHQELPSPRLVDGQFARTAPRDDEAAGIVAMARSDRDQREAVRLDREGRFQESRARFRQSADHLAFAPETVKIMDERAMVRSLAEAPERPLDEHVRKQRIQDTHSRSRGRRPADS